MGISNIKTSFLSLLILGILGLSLFSGELASASYVNNLEDEELSAVNWLLQCPTELAKITNDLGGQFVRVGSYEDGKDREVKRYDFYRQSGFTEQKYVATLSITRTRIDNPPADGVGHKLNCDVVVKETSIQN